MLYEGVFHPYLKNVAFVGMYRGPYFTIMELQARWACLAFCYPQLYYPLLSEMQKGVEKERQIRNAHPRPQFPHGDFVSFADQLAHKIGVFPDKECVERFPVVASQFRLRGPFCNPEIAWDVLMGIP